MEPFRLNTAAVDAPVRWPAERRQRSRNRIFTPAYASFHGANALDLHEILDMHEEGFCTQAPPTLDLNRNVSLRLVLSEVAGPLSVAGRIVWSDRGRLGVQFDPLPPDRLVQLQRWLFLNAMNASAEEEGGVSHATIAAIEEPVVLTDRSSLLSALDAVRREVQLVASSDSALPLVADRALSFTGASGCAVALVEAGTMVCRASSGKDAPPIGASFQVGAGFSGECVRRRAILRCDDTETDPYVDAEGCRALGIRSILAVPLLSRDSVVGLLELFSPTTHGFRERDEEIAARMSEFAVAALGRSEIDSNTTALSSFPFADSLNRDTHSIPLRPSHILLLITVAALVALVLGYVLAPWLERVFTATPKPVSLLPAEQSTSRSIALNPTTVASSENTVIADMRRLAERGDPAAQFSMGTHYAIGDGVKLDSAEAARWFTKAAEQGHVIAQDTIGAYYQVGRGVPKDLHKAYFWSFLSGAGNNQTSQHRIHVLSGSMSREDVEAARHDAEQWIHQHSLAANSSPPTP